MNLTLLQSKVEKSRKKFYDAFSQQRVNTPIAFHKWKNKFPLMFNENTLLFLFQKYSRCWIAKTVSISYHGFCFTTKSKRYPEKYLPPYTCTREDAILFVA